MQTHGSASVNELWTTLGICSEIVNPQVPAYFSHSEVSQNQFAVKTLQLFSQQTAQREFTISGTSIYKT